MDAKREPGVLIAEGKTKFILSTEKPGWIHIRSKDDITAGDGARHDVIPGKGMLANQTTCNIFHLLRHHKIPLAFERKVAFDTFRAREAKMIPLEVVGRIFAEGSYLKRHPQISKGDHFESPVVEFFLKTTSKVFKVPAFPGLSFNLPKDDMLLCEESHNMFSVLYPHAEGGVLFYLPYEHVGVTEKDLEKMKTMTHEIASVLEYAWNFVGGTLIDFKIEFGWVETSQGSALTVTTTTGSSINFIAIWKQTA